MKKSKGKETLKIVAMTALSISVLSASFIGINNIALEAATTGVATLPPITAPVVAQQEAPVEETTFTPPTLTVLANPEQYIHTAPPAYALSMEEAAQIGARYLWDVFDMDINGMYVDMLFISHASHINPWWLGTVAASENAVRWTYEASEYYAPLATFIINGITGARSDIRYIGVIDRSPPTPEESERIWTGRMGLLEIGWFEMSHAEQIEFANFSPEAMENYKQAAMDFAVRHFNTSTVVDVQLHSINAAGLIVSGDESVLDIAWIGFYATDDTGREANIILPPEDATSRIVSISTQHNDFVPGFVFEDDGRGRG